MAYAQMLNRTAMLHPAMAAPACLARVGTRVPKLTSCTCLGAGRRYFAASRHRQLQSAKRYSTAPRVFAMGLPTTSPPSGTDYEIWVKGSPEGIDKGNNWSEKGKLGDCPFSQRSMMTFEELGLKYKPYYIDEQNMPEWIKEVPGLEGKQQIPFVHEVASDKWMGDSDKFLGEITEKQENGKKIGTPDSTPQVGTELMPKFMGFMRSKPGQDEDEKKGELLSELTGIDDYLKQHGGPYIGGESPNATDLRLAPQMNHVRIGADEIKGWNLPSDKLSHLLKWHDEMKSRASWKNTAPDSEQYVRDGWQVKMKTMDKMEKEQN